MRPSANVIKLIKQFEGCRLRAYQDAVGIWSIGFGSTRYTDGAKVNMGDVITMEKADAMLYITLQDFAYWVYYYVQMPLTQNQFDALCSFAYNVGIGAFRRSTLLKKINVDPNDPTIEAEFLKWNKAGGKVLVGLTKRRQQEADLYFKD
jgi:lysozyme